ncbi:MAG: phosphotransferase [Calditrichaeota bacterium]|nr:phosphotransferase [Calditrichota bacterium]
MDIQPLIPKIEKHLGTPIRSIEKVNSGASSRRYFLLHLDGETYFPRDEVLIMLVPLADIQILLDYMNVDYYLRRMHIPTPRIFEVWEEAGIIFLEYVRWPRLDMFIHAHPEQMEHALRQTIQFLQHMQQNCLWESHCPAFHRRFDEAKYQFEFRFHVREQLLERFFGVHLSANLEQAFEAFAQEISQTLDVKRPTFVHRDFQSSNMFFESQSADHPLKIIDFQDARHGLPVYDLVSILWDSYIPVPDSLRATLTREFYDYLRDTGIDWSYDQYLQYVDYTIIQRKLHDAGAFAYNYHRFKSRHFLQFIPNTLDMVIQVLEKYPRFAPLTELFAHLNQEKSA